MAVASAGRYASAPHSRQMTIPVFTGCMPFLLPNQQRQSANGQLACDKALYYKSVVSLL